MFLLLPAIILLVAPLVGQAQNLQCADIARTFNEAIPYHASQQTSMAKSYSAKFLARNSILNTFSSVDPRGLLFLQSEIDTLLVKGQAQQRAYLRGLGIDLRLFKTRPSKQRIQAAEGRNLPTIDERQCKKLISRLYHSFSNGLRRHQRLFPDSGANMNSPSWLKQAELDWNHNVQSSSSTGWSRNIAQLKVKFVQALTKYAEMQQHEKGFTRKEALTVAAKTFLRSRHWLLTMNQEDFNSLILKGLLKSLDPYSDFMVGQQKAWFDLFYSGRFGPVPALDIYERAQGLEFDLGPLRSKTSSRLLAGDVVTAIAGVSAQNMSPIEALTLLAEHQKAPIPLEVLSGHIKRTVLFDVPTDSLTSEKLSYNVVQSGDGKLAHIRLKNFYRGSGQHVEQILKTLSATEDKLSGVILDLRDSPGGIVDEAQKIAGHFLSGGVVLQEYGFNWSYDHAFPETKVLNDPDSIATYTGPLAVLINKQTASAGEIVVSALRDHQRALIIGDHSEATFGKSTSQSNIPLLGSYLKLTTHFYFSPKGKSYLGQGIPADLVIGDTAHQESFETGPTVYCQDLKGIPKMHSALAQASLKNSPWRLISKALKKQLKILPHSELVFAYKDPSLEVAYDIINELAEPKHLAQLRRTRFPKEH